jgi:hypothetical protein
MGKGATQSKAGGGQRKTKDQAMAAREGKINPLGSAKFGMTQALSYRMSRAIPAGTTPPGGWFEMPKPK